MTTLVILAAGLGSRFGGNKQFVEFGQQQLTLMEYNIINAADAGFTRIIFVIRPELTDTLTQQVLNRLPKNINYDIAFQTFEHLPKGCSVPQERTKPLGTAHALWCCHHLLDSSFAVINADDYYGKQAFSLLLTQAKLTPNNHLMVAFALQNTLSDFGGVNRGLCQLSKNNELQSIQECLHIQQGSNGITGIPQNTAKEINLDANQLISMNCWYFTTDIITLLAEEISTMLNSSANIKSECYLPEVVMKQIKAQHKTVSVLASNEQWFGVTYPQDAEQVNQKISLIYP